MSINNHVRPRVYAFALLTVITIFGLPFSVSTAQAETTDEVRPFSEARFTRSIQSAVKELQRAHKKDPEIDPFDFFLRLDEKVPYGTPEEGQEALRSLAKLDRKYQNNDAYLYLSSALVTLTIPLPESLSKGDIKALKKFLNGLPENHGNAGRMQKLRIMNSLLQHYPGLEDAFREQMNAEELLVFNTGMAAWFNLTKYPGSDAYEELGGDPLGPVFDEPSLDFVDVIGRLVPPEKDEDRFKWAEDIASIDRYLYFRGERPTEKRVKRAEKFIAQEREAWRDGRVINDTVLYGATAGEEDRFLDERELSRLGELSRDVQIFAADEERSAGDTRAAFLKAIETTEGPVTAVLNMHGNDEVVAFQDASRDDTAVLGADELADAFAARYAEDPDRSERDVLILETCSAGTYGIFFLEQLVFAEAPIPIVLAAGEAGQTTLSKEEGGSEFAEHYLFMGSQTLGDLYDNYNWEDIGSNPLILVPQTTDPYLPLQVS